MNNNIVDDEDLMYNTAKRVPICICVNSSATETEKNHVSEVLNEVKKGVDSLYAKIEESDNLRDCAEISVVSFGNTPDVAQDYTCLSNYNQGLNFVVKDTTSSGDLGVGINCALDLLQNRKQIYNAHGVGYYQPWLIVINDGKQTLKEHKKSVTLAAKKTLSLEKSKKITIITINISSLVSSNDGADGGKKSKDKSIKLSKTIEPQVINKNKIAHFFEWLGHSIDTVAFENEIKLDFSGLTDWEDI
ncbi:MAG: hypothetical protein R3Y60_03095 [bacterium]